jgi:hypothetical protein
MRQLSCKKHATLASRFQWQLFVQCMWLVSQDERPESTAHQAEQASSDNSQKDWHQLFELQHVDDNAVASQWRRLARVQRMRLVLQIAQGMSQLLIVETS